jgi:hypothetical protein
MNDLLILPEVNVGTVSYSFYRDFYNQLEILSVGGEIKVFGSDKSSLAVFAKSKPKPSGTNKEYEYEIKDLTCIVKRTI